MAETYEGGSDVPNVRNAQGGSKSAGRPKTGGLIWRKKGWVARVSMVVDGESVRQSIDLGTTHKPVAKRKLKRLLGDLEAKSLEQARQRAASGETVDQYAETWFQSREARGVASAGADRVLFAQYWSGDIGAMALTDVRSGHIRQVLGTLATGQTLGVRGRRLSKKSITGIRGVALQVFDSAWQDELTDENPVARVKLKGLCPHEVKKQRAVPTDAELGQLLACRDVSPELKMLVMLVRTVGGMRTSDLHSLDWTAFGPGFTTLRVPRRKTRKDRGAQELDVPADVLPFIETWWLAAGRPASGPVFPVRRGSRAGRQKGSNYSYAKAFRSALLAAGVRRHVCTRSASAEPRKRDEPCCPAMATDPLYSETADTLPTDFHSTRRAYCTALAKAGCNSQTAQVLAGHSSAAVHQRYVSEATIRALPAAAMLSLPVLAGSVPKTEPAAPAIFNDSDALLPCSAPLFKRFGTCQASKPAHDSAHIGAHAVGAADPVSGWCSDVCHIALPKPQPGLSKAVDPSFRRVAKLARELASAAEQGSTGKVEALIGSLLLAKLPRQRPAEAPAMAPSCEGRASC